jgi:type I restriction-modification system DNA methylase subunit
MREYSENFVKGIKSLDFVIGPSDAGSVLLLEPKDYQYQTATEIFALEQASWFRADAVYFRRFIDNRDPVAQIYIYDNTEGKWGQDNYADIHRNIWSSCVVPLFMVIEKSSIRVYDCRNPVELFMGEISTTPLEVLDFSSDALRKYSAKLFDNGAFWEDSRFSKHFLEEQSAYYKLISGLRKIRNVFIEKSGLPIATAHKLLVQSILIKYLEERGDEGEMLFARRFFESFGAGDFCGVLRKKGQIVPLFERLSKHFNGKIFEWNDPAEKELIRKKDLSQLADFLDGNNEKEQYVLWRLYSFRHLPVELISSVYEEFLGKGKKDVVYTPHYLVNLLVDECMPINEPKKNFKLIDVSCGSGIFLVVAFKRLVSWWRYDHYRKTGKLVKPDARQLLKILKENIYGVDIAEDSTKLTIFSLALALCDMLTPKQIWTELRFDDLRSSNIFAEDFFKFLTKTNLIKYDLVIGNPPFNPPQQVSSSAYFKQITKDYNLQFEAPIPDQNVALIFLDQAMKLLKKDAKLCLILKAGPLLYNNTLQFRQYFFKKYNVLQIIDFSSLKGILFGKASVETAALFVQNCQPDEKPILHLAVRNTRPVEQKLFFEFDHYDFHFVTKIEAFSSQTIWKSNLLGGGRLNDLINRFKRERNLGEYLKLQTEEREWKVGEGFSRGVKETAVYLTGKKAVLSSTFTVEKYMVTQKLSDEYFERPRPAELYKAPILLIREMIDPKRRIPVHLIDFDAGFDSSLVGIKAPARDKDLLTDIESRFRQHQETFVFFILSTAAKFFLGDSTAIIKEDIMNLPYPVRSKDLQLSSLEKIIRDDVLQYRFEELYAGQRAKVNAIAKKKDLESFGIIFCKAINFIYAEEAKKYRLVKIFVSDTFYACQFLLTSKETDVKYDESAKAEESIGKLVENTTGGSVRIARVLKLYTKDSIYLLKPKQLRYWLKSVALRDSDETFDEILDQDQ